jgi:hypothetical protein
MDIKPALQVTRLEKLTPGDLFIFDWSGGQSAAIKITDPKENGQKLTLLLGPAFTGTGNAGGPELIQEQRISVVSFGTNYTIRFPVSPTDWMINEKPTVGAYMATNGNDVFFRIPTPQWELYINLKNGELCGAIPQGILAYTKAWEIVIPDADTPRVVVKGA